MSMSVPACDRRRRLMASGPVARRAAVFARARPSRACSCASGLAGAPPQVSPAGTSCMTPARAATIWRPAPMVTWSATPARPPNWTPSPTITLPEMPVWPASTQLRPMRHVVGDLDQIVDLGVLADHGVVEGAAVDAGVGADGDAVLHDHPAELGHVDRPRRRDAATPKPASPITAPAEIAHPVADQGEADADVGADAGSRGRWPRPGRSRSWRRSPCPRRSRAPGPITTPWCRTTPSLDLGRRDGRRRRPDRGGAAGAGARPPRPRRPGARR